MCRPAEIKDNYTYILNTYWSSGLALRSHSLYSMITSVLLVRSERASCWESERKQEIKKWKSFWLLHRKPSVSSKLAKWSDRCIYKTVCHSLTLLWVQVTPQSHCGECMTPTWIMDDPTGQTLGQKAAGPCGHVSVTTLTPYKFTCSQKWHWINLLRPKLSL